MPKKDRTDPICGMRGHIKAHGHYFCSVGCIRKFEKREKIKKDLYCPECAKSAHGHKKRWYKERLYQVLIVLGTLFAMNQMLLVYGISILQGFWLAFYDYLLLIWWAIILGFLIGGIIDYLVPSEYISKFLSRRERKTIGWAVVLGFLMSACSHGILAISMELYRKGASVPAVIAFLLASPWANLPITILLFGLFGFNAIFIIMSAIIIAVITGFVYQFLDRRGWVERSRHTRHVSGSFSVRKDMAERLRNYRKNPSTGRVLKGVAEGSWSLTKMVMWWILIGVMAAGIARSFISHEMFMAYMGPTLLGLFVTLAIATVIEVCSEGSSPISFEIYRQTGAFGNAFVFLNAGVATDYTEIGLIASNIGKRSALWLPIITVPQILVLGYLFNMLV